MLNFSFAEKFKLLKFKTVSLPEKDVIFILLWAVDKEKPEFRSQIVKLAISFIK